jgi:hypothetical protein
MSTSSSTYSVVVSDSGKVAWVDEATSIPIVIVGLNRAGSEGAMLQRQILVVGAVEQQRLSWIQRVSDGGERHDDE